VSSEVEGAHAALMTQTLLSEDLRGIANERGQVVYTAKRTLGYKVMGEKFFTHWLPVIEGTRLVLAFVLILLVFVACFFLALFNNAQAKIYVPVCVLYSFEFITGPYFTLVDTGIGLAIVRRFWFWSYFAIILMLVLCSCHNKD